MPDTRQAKVCMLGGFAVGKSSLVRRVVEGRFSERYVTTVGVRIERLDVPAGGRAARLMLWDIAGDDDFATVRSSYLRGAAGYALVVDAARGATLETALALHGRARSLAGDVPFVLLVNKADLALRDVDAETLGELASRGWRIHEVSARTGGGVAEAFADLAFEIFARPQRHGSRDRRALRGPEPGPADREMALEVLCAQETLVLTRVPGGEFRAVGRPPGWAMAEYPAAADGGSVIPQRRYAFLESFLEEAGELWAAAAPGGQLCSGPFREGAGAAMEATAMTIAGRPVLLLRRLGAEHEDRVAVLQRARENLLEQDRLEAEVARRTRDIRRREEEIALRLVSAAESRDGDTGAHVRRIGLYSAAIARALGWSEQMIDDLRMAAPMHDIGKLAVPDDILLSPGPLTADQWALMRTHTTVGAAVLEGSDAPLLQMACTIARGHHEWWDGSGYPAGLAGEAIPEAARIVAVADVYDALVNERPYKAALPEREALAEMAAERGTHFDPAIFDAFISELPRIRELQLAVDATGPLVSAP